MPASIMGHRYLAIILFVKTDIKPDNSIYIAVASQTKYYKLPYIITFMMTMSASKPRITSSLILVIVIIGLIPIPFIDLVNYSEEDTMSLSIDGIATSVYIVLGLGICSSLILSVALCTFYKNLSITGVLFSILAAQIIILPISQIIGPVLGVILGCVAGIGSFILLKKKPNLLAA